MEEISFIDKETGKKMVQVGEPTLEVIGENLTEYKVTYEEEKE